jgi:hypothetical protein
LATFFTKFVSVYDLYLGTGQKPPDKEHFYFLEEDFANFWYFNGILYVIVVQMYTQLFQSTKLIKLNLWYYEKFQLQLV